MATYTIKDTAPVAVAFAKANIKKPLLSILPYVVICGMITAIVDKSHPVIAILVQLASMYFSFIYASHIHRSFLHGVPSNGFDPFRPSRDDWRFIGMIFLIALLIIVIPCAALLAMYMVGGFNNGGSGFITIILFVISIFIAIWLAWRFSLVLPDRAVGGNMKLQDSFRLTHGIVLKMILTPIAASWIAVLAGLGWILMAALIGTGILYAISGQAADTHNPLVQLLFYVLMAPATIGVAFWCSTVGVASLSNYYLWVKENRA